MVVFCWPAAGAISASVGRTISAAASTIIRGLNMRNSLIFFDAVALLDLPIRAYRLPREIGGLPGAARRIDPAAIWGRVHDEGQARQQHGGNPDEVMDAEEAPGTESNELAGKPHLPAHRRAAGDEKNHAANEHHRA